MKKGIFYTVVGGALVFLFNIILGTFVSSPPSRAEFDTLKVEHHVHIKSIDGRLERIEGGQKIIIEHLLGE